MTESAQIPWYRQFWPWFLMVPPAAAVLGGFLTAFLAGGPPSLVVDDYGQIAMATETRAARDAMATRLGLSADLVFGAQSPESLRSIEIRLVSDTGTALPDQISVRLIHPTLERLDRRVTLERDGGHYRGTIERPAVRYRVQVEDGEGTWRLAGRLPPKVDELELTAQTIGGNMAQ
jgi:hypothetical protein